MQASATADVMEHFLVVRVMCENGGGGADGITLGARRVPGTNDEFEFAAVCVRGDAHETCDATVPACMFVDCVVKLYDAIRMRFAPCRVSLELSDGSVAFSDSFSDLHEDLLAFAAALYASSSS